MPSRSRAVTSRLPIVWMRAAIAAALLPAGVLLLLVVTVLGAPDQANGDAGGPAYAASSLAQRDIPAAYLALYQQAGQRYGLDWAILAAVGKIETDHGRSREPGVTSGVNSYGCCGGPMQFWVAPPHPNTWDQYGVDGNADGRRDPYDPADAIPAAARYLHASGAPGDYRRALFAYNHATWYVTEVLDQAARYRGTQPGLTDALPATGGDRLATIIATADAIDRAHIPYCYGGGHATTPARPTRGQYCWHDDPERKVYGDSDQGLDCSSAVSLVLQRAGYDLPTMTSGELAGWGRPGPGKAVTIWANAEHVYLQIGVRYWGTSQENPRHGPGWHSARSGTGFVARHPAGL
jgi:hypothetical protein